MKKVFVVFLIFIFLFGSVSAFNLRDIFSFFWERDSVEVLDSIEEGGQISEEDGREYSGIFCDYLGPCVWGGDEIFCNWVNESFVQTCVCGYSLDGGRWEGAAGSADIDSDGDGYFVPYDEWRGALFCADGPIDCDDNDPTVGASESITNSISGVSVDSCCSPEQGPYFYSSQDVACCDGELSPVLSDGTQVCCSSDSILYESFPGRYSCCFEELSPIAEDGTQTCCSSLYVYYVDSDGDGYGSGDPIESCYPMPLEGYSLNNLDCDDGDDRIYPGSNFCYSEFLALEGLFSGLDDPEEEVSSGCYVCSPEGERIPNDECNPSNSGNCNKCVGGELVPDDDSLVALNICQKCVEGELIFSDDGSVFDDYPCFKCQGGFLVFDGSLNLPNSGDCLKCEGGELVPDDSDLIVAEKPCKYCFKGELQLVDGYIFPGNPCRVCIEGELDLLSGLIEGNPCEVCFEGDVVVDDSLNLPDSGDCIKCEGGELVDDDSDEIIFGNPCQECFNGEIVFLTKDIEWEDCKKCVEGFKVNVLDGPLLENPCRACIEGELEFLTGVSSNLGECQKCEGGEIIDVEDGDVCGYANPLSMCCGGACSFFSSNSVKDLSTCCGGEIQTANSRRDFRRHSCCEEEYVSLRSSSDCGVCGRECEEGAPFCYMSAGFSEDCYKCVECLSSSDCPGAQVCVLGSKNCLRIFPPSLRGVFREVIYAATPAEAIDLLRGRFGYSSDLICGGAGYEAVSIDIVSVSVGSFVPGSGLAFRITYRVVVNTYDSGGNLL